MGTRGWAPRALAVVVLEAALRVRETVPAARVISTLE